MATTVLIPARNEESTIGHIVGQFATYPGEEMNVYVAVDRDTTDKTSQVVLDWEGIPVPFNIHGKGELISAAVWALEQSGLISERIILCDGDCTGLTWKHIMQLTHLKRGMTIGVPDWPECDVPEHVTLAWPKVSGFRCLPWTLVPRNGHGYLLETQLNQAAARSRMPINTVFMDGLKVPFTWPLSPRRMAALERDREWGTRNGVL